MWHSIAIPKSCSSLLANVEENFFFLKKSNLTLKTVEIGAKFVIFLKFSLKIVELGYHTHVVSLADGRPWFTDAEVAEEVF